MLNVNHFDHINMNVKNFNETAEFYKDVLGFEIKEQGEENGKPWGTLGVVGRAYLCIYEIDDVAGFKGEGINRDEGVMLNHFGFHINNFDEAYKTLKENNIELYYGGGGAVSHGKSRSLYIKDPNDFVIELSEKFGGDLH